ncbi:MAG: 4-hydroxy-tetrahydrodipicolinate synthase [Bacteroidales bacterium]|jgi:4-hydroxy-tetrahydrodipicolinate synthase|nr:4-hydroxy-tetrahydrodipicolinate synthase [Bacteroidales bacterium]MDD2687593.1 4-hydroxy-tetrahydrodipicolinate synthase [Bacteroidales bacterium]MDD3330574.1 4-hydroxy-tetrahydrodipicolinate synthase [Bacteroidales bacterium]MDD3691791.1 4-hydroxy-tetrahydrodipicolinate synthase [Bacteroidales bacterium]MDD4044795.1 4-hydroxy-tetrahydrodipicolinate synthase [Bacteroidales bacterium]
MKLKLKGAGVALITPFKKDFSIDFEAIERLVEYQIQEGTDYIVALGTTAETPTLSFTERKEILRTVVQTVKGRIPVVVGIGSNNTMEVIEQIYLYDLKKVDAVLSVAPYYNRPQQEGIFQHYKAIAKASPLPIILYNVASRTAVNIEAETTLRIAKEIPKVIGIKEASGNFSQIMHIMEHKSSDFLVISGDDIITLPLMACGLDGLISVVANAYPKCIVQMIQSALDGDYQTARALHYRLLPVMEFCFKEGSPSGVKAFVESQGRAEHYVRLPLVDVSESLKHEINRVVNSMK